jgi:5-methylcytosine-specific restriction enzyme A
VRLPRVCLLRGPGCSDGGVAVPGSSRCRAHGGRVWQRKDPSRQAAYRGDWARLRKIVLEREPLCHWGLRGCTRISTTADHVLAVARGGTNDLANLVAFCWNCNQKRGSSEGGKAAKARRRSVTGREENET